MENQIYINNNDSNELDGDSNSNQVNAMNLSELCFEWIEAIAQAIVAMVIIITFFFRIANVEGNSMRNTLMNKDKLFVWVWNYVPKNNDVVVIRKGQKFDKPIVKRVIAREGQSLSIDFVTGKVTVDGKVLDEYYLPEQMWLQGDAEIPSVIPTGYTFVMGDNRNHSADSRFTEIGLIPNDYIVGKAIYILMPFSRFGLIS